MDTTKQKMVKELLDRPMTMNRTLIRLTGSHTGALLLSQAMYWEGAMGREFYKTNSDWQEELLMKEVQFNNARKACKKYLSVVKKGLPAKNWYKVNWDILVADIENIESSVTNDTYPTSDPLNIPHQSPMFHRSLDTHVSYPTITETTSESTTDIKGNFDKFPLECSNLETAKVAGSQGDIAPTKKTAAPKFKQTAKAISNMAQNKPSARVQQDSNTSRRAKLPSAKNPKTRELIEYTYSVAPQTWRFVTTGNNRDTFVLQRLLTSGRFTVEQLKAMIDLAVKWQPRTQANEFKPEIFDFAKLEIQSSKIFSSLPASIRLSGQQATVAPSPPAVHVDPAKDSRFAADKASFDFMLDRWEAEDKEFAGMRWNYRMSISQAKELVKTDRAEESWQFQGITEDFKQYGNDWLHDPSASVESDRETLLRKLNWQVVSDFCNAPNAVDKNIRDYLDLVVPRFAEITQPDVMLNKLSRLTTVKSLPKNQYWVFDLWEYGKWKDYIVELIEKHNVPRFEPVHYTEVHAAFMAELEKEYRNV